MPSLLVIRNRTSYPDQEVRDLVRFGLADVDASRVCVNVKRMRSGVQAAAGVFYHGVPSISNAPPSSENLITLRLPAASHYPLPWYQDGRGPVRSPMQYVRCHDWREALVAIAAHEGRHLHQYREKRRGGEVDADEHAFFRLARYRQERLTAEERHTRALVELDRRTRAWHVILNEAQALPERTPEEVWARLERRGTKRTLAEVRNVYAALLAAPHVHAVRTIHVGRGCVLGQEHVGCCPGDPGCDKPGWYPSPSSDDDGASQPDRGLATGAESPDDPTMTPTTGTHRNDRSAAARASAGRSAATDRPHQTVDKRKENEMARATATPTPAEAEAGSTEPAAAAPVEDVTGKKPVTSDDLLKRFVAEAKSEMKGLETKANAKVGYTAFRTGGKVIGYAWTTKKPLIRVEVALKLADVPKERRKAFEACKRSAAIQCQTRVTEDSGFSDAIEALKLAAIARSPEATPAAS